MKKIEWSLFALYLIIWEGMGKSINKDSCVRKMFMDLISFEINKSRKGKKGRTNAKAEYETISNLLLDKHDRDIIIRKETLNNIKRLIIPVVTRTYQEA